MKKAVVLFSGQGQQFPNMGQDFYKNQPVYRQLIDESSQILGRDFSQQSVFDDTKNVQLSVLLFSLGIHQMIKSLIIPQAYIGLSLGEYSALMAAQSIDLSQGLPLVCDRAKYMQAAGQHHSGRMLAVLNAPTRDISDSLQKARKQGDIFLANDNTPKQKVFAGEDLAIQSFYNELKARGVKRLIDIKVDALSHTPFMQEAYQKLGSRLKQIQFRQPRVPVISNTTVHPFTVDTLPETLANQIVQPTQFGQCLKAVESPDIDCIIQVGPGKSLTGFAKKIWSTKIPLFNVYDLATLQKLQEFLK